MFVSEIILTIGHSKTVETFLKTAAHHRSFTVLIAETGPSYVLPAQSPHFYSSNEILTPSLQIQRP